MGAFEFPREVWTDIFRFLYRIPPRPGVETTWAELHQQDLTMVMRVNTLFHNAAAPVVYNQAITDDPKRFFAGMKRGSTYHATLGRIETMTRQRDPILRELLAESGQSEEDDAASSSSDFEEMGQEAGGNMIGEVTTGDSVDLARKTKLDLLSLVKGLHIVHKPQPPGVTYLELSQTGWWDIAPPNSDDDWSQLAQFKLRRLSYEIKRTQ